VCPQFLEVKVIITAKALHYWRSDVTKLWTAISVADGLASHQFREHTKPAMPPLCPRHLPRTGWTHRGRARLRGEISMGETHRRLMWHGMFLFLLGLLTGFAEQHFANIRMGLAAHLEGVINGILLVALGAAWSGVRLSRLTKKIAYWTALCSTYGNWFVTTLAAIFGTAALSPITGAGHSGRPWQESLVTVGFLTVGITIVTFAVLFLWGLRARAIGEQT